eukprot:UN00090
MSEKKTIAEDAPISAQEQQWIDEMKAIHGGALYRANLADLDLLRFTRAYINEPDPKQKTFDTVAAYVKWYAEDKIYDVATQDLEGFDKFQKMWPCGLRGVSTCGHAVYFDECGKMSPSEFSKTFTAEQYLSYHIQIMEHLQQTKREISEKLGKPIYKHIVVLDLQGFGMSHIYDRTQLEKMAQLDSTKYPETLHKMLIINPPWLFKAIYAIGAMFLDDTTKSRIHVVKDPKDLDKHFQYAEDSEEVLKDLKEKYKVSYAKNLQKADEYDAANPKKDVAESDEKKDQSADKKDNEEDKKQEDDKKEEKPAADEDKKEDAVAQAKPEAKPE